MSRSETDKVAMEALDSLLDNQTRWEHAIRKADIPTANKHALRMTHAVRALRESESGRSELEKLLANSKPNLRLWAAGSVLEWAPDIAVPVLAKLLYELLERDSTPQEDVSIQMNAEGYLARYFGLHPSDTREMPGRLAAMGIELPEKTARQLRRER